MADAVLFGIAQEVLKNLGSRALSEIASTWGFKDELNKLNNTINLIKGVLLDAEEKQADSNAVRTWLEQLATVVYAADDLFDEFNTVASRKQLLGGNKFCKEVHTFFSSSNQITFAIKFSRKIKSVREKLEAIRRYGADLGLAQRTLQQGTVVAVRRETHSYVDAQEVIGRDADKKAILDLLLDSGSTVNEQEVLQVLPIVGMGGMGKTTLAQLIYNDPQVENYFELRLWVCVGQDFNVEVITKNILMSATGSEISKLNMDQLQKKLREQVSGKKYFLVMDDVWEEDPNKWEELKPLLKNGRNGSKILVTTRSTKVADIMGTFPHHELQELSEDKSWDLFEKMAFKSGEAQQKPHLVNVGKELVNKCANVPLAIVTLARLVRYTHESKWLSFKDQNNLDTVRKVLNLSYQHLFSPLKNCFAYCALFPEDYEFEKEMLIELWMAEGFIIPCVDGGSSLEDVAEGYFENLLQRGFFQNVKRNEWGDITSCKMHDLMHDLALDVAKAKCKVTEVSQTDFEDKILHLSFASPFPPSWKIPNKMLNLKMLRTILYTKEFCEVSVFCNSTFQQAITKFQHLRVLKLGDLELKSLPNSIGKLIHLRYLNLSWSMIETLPDISSCDDLIYIPSGIGGLTLLHKLPIFIVSHKQNVELRHKPTNTAKLSDLKKLNKLRGKLSIYIYSCARNDSLQVVETDIIDKHGLTTLNVVFESETTCESNKIKQHDEAVLEGLKPHCELRELGIYNYGGEKLPSWAMMDNLCKFLPKLVHIILGKCRNCQQVASLGKLRFLKSLWLGEMESVVYMESEVVDASPSSISHGIENLFFPSLEELRLIKMKNLKGWWKEATTSNEKGGTSRQQHDHHHLLSLQFVKLSNLIIEECPNLINMPLCPNLEELTLEETNKKLRLMNRASISASFPSSEGWASKLKILELDDVQDLISLSELGLCAVSRLYLKDKNLESTERLEEVFATLSSSLRELSFIYCRSLRTISKGLEHLTALESLSFWSCKELQVFSTIAEDGNEDMMPWKAFKTSLCILILWALPKAVSLPSGIQHLENLTCFHLDFMQELREIPEWISSLSSLQYLTLSNCPKLRNLPQGFQNLTSLNQLRIHTCPGLRERCRSPNGADWPKIQHIPKVTIED